MIPFRNATIRSKLLFIMMLSGIPIFLVFCLFIANQCRDALLQDDREALAAVQAIAFEQNSQVEGIKNLLIALSQHPVIRAKDAAGSARILNLVLEQSPSNLNVGVADRSGRVIATGIRQPLPISYGVADRKYFRDAIRTKRFSSGEYTVSRAVRAPTPTLHLALPVLDASGNPELVLYAALDLTRFGRIFGAQHLPRDAALDITDHNGVVLYRYPMTEAGAHPGMADHIDLRKHMTGSRDQGVFAAVGMDGQRRQFAFKRLHLAPDARPYLYLRVSIPQKIVLAKIGRIFAASAVVFLVATLLTFFLTKVILGRYLAQPLKQLVDTSVSVAQGNLSMRSGISYSSDEIGQLAKSFDAMTDSLHQRLLEINQAQSEKHRLAYYDPLTDLPNRRLLQDRLDLALIRSRRHGSSMALLYIDLDNFKHINDTLGHAAGDRLLQEMASRYLAVLREDDIVCRLGGDEFAVILHDIRQDEDVVVVVEKLLEASGAPLMLEGKELNVSASIGVALYPKDAQDVISLEKNADLALYHAKDEGKNTFRMFSERLNISSHERMILTNALRHVLDHQELTLLYQPIVSIASGRVTGVEALLRWKSPEFGKVSPERFIPIAEESRLIIPIGEWVLRKACAQQVAWKGEGINLTVTVNISAVQLKTPTLVERIRGILDETGMEPDRLELELTESCLVDKPDETILILQRLRDLRCRIAIDDFGTGYSSLSYLKHFPVTILKIDRSFVKDLTHNPGDRAIAQSVVDLATNLNMATVAEGVERPEQLRILEEIGCTYVQGFLFCRPVPPEQITVQGASTGVDDAAS